MEYKTKVLYVDDESINLDLFVINFSHKYNVLTANNADNGLDLIRNNNDISIIISDMKMPGMNGLDFISTAKNEFPDKTYFILTGFSITQEIKDAIASGIIHQYFSKPFNIQEIDKTMENLAN